MRTEWTGPDGSIYGEGPVAESLRERHMRLRALALDVHELDRPHCPPPKNWKNPESWPRCAAIVIQKGQAIDRMGHEAGEVGHVECCDPAALAVFAPDGDGGWLCWTHAIERAHYHKHRVTDHVVAGSARCEVCATPAAHLRSWGFACDHHNVEPRPKTYRWGVAIGPCCEKDRGRNQGSCSTHKRFEARRA